ncbi:MAG TPA: PHB depolymerase family esterase [Tepidisphaeraceae bacterium]|nr:PHB depolymerase family esterase [Tepidisphaeraceae bacterium]
MRRLAVILLVMPAIALGQATTQPRDSLRRGEFHTTFTEQDPRSPIEAQNRRHHIRIQESQRYKLPEESFEAYVPRDYDSSNAYGILVWVNAGNRGQVPRGWDELLDKHKLIFISADNSGNERGVGVRFGLAMDAVFNLQKTYNIDPARVYAGGVSGGGKVASMLAVIYPETFSGAMPCVGVSYFRDIPLAGDPTHFWAHDFDQPPLAMLDRAKQLGRIVLITGGRDMNRDSIQGTYERGYLPDGFKNVEYIEVPDMGHTLPPIERIEGAINNLDEPLPGLAARMLEMGQQLQRSHKDAEAHQLYQAVKLHGDARLAARAEELLTASPIVKLPKPTKTIPATRPAVASPVSREVEAQQLLSLAEGYERNKFISQARERAQRIVREFADTPSAAKARQMLQRLASQ